MPNDARRKQTNFNRLINCEDTQGLMGTILQLTLKQLSTMLSFTLVDSSCTGVTQHTCWPKQHELQLASNVSAFAPVPPFCLCRRLLTTFVLTCYRS